MHSNLSTKYLLEDVVEHRAIINNNHMEEPGGFQVFLKRTRRSHKGAGRFLRYFIHTKRGHIKYPGGPHSTGKTLEMYAELHFLPSWPWPEQPYTHYAMSLTRFDASTSKPRMHICLEGSNIRDICIVEIVGHHLISPFPITTYLKELGES